MITVASVGDLILDEPDPASYLAAFAGTGPATAGVLKNGEVPTGSLDQAAASAAAVGSGLVCCWLADPPSADEKEGHRGLTLAHQDLAGSRRQRS